MANKRLRLKDDELEIIQEFRRIKDESIKQGIPIEDVKHGWIKSDRSSLFFKNPKFKDQTTQQFEKLKESLISQFKDYAPNYPTQKRTKSTYKRTPVKKLSYQLPSVSCNVPFVVLLGVSVCKISFPIIKRIFSISQPLDSCKIPLTPSFTLLTAICWL